MLLRSKVTYSNLVYDEIKNLVVYIKSEAIAFPFQKNNMGQDEELESQIYFLERLSKIYSQYTSISPWDKL